MQINTQHTEGKYSLMQQSKRLKDLRVSKANSVDRQHGELCIGPEPVARTGQKVRVFGSSSPSKMLSGQA